MKIIHFFLPAIFSLLFSCMSVNHHLPETIEPGTLAVDVYATNYAAPAVAGENILSDYAIGWQFGIIPRLGISDYSEVGLKLCLPEMLFYYKHRLPLHDFPLTITLVGELGLYSELPNLNQIVIFSKELGPVTPYGGIKNIFIMGMEGAIFDLSYKGDLFLSAEWRIIQHLTIMAEYNYTFFWKAFGLGGHSISLGLSVD